MVPGGDVVASLLGVEASAVVGGVPGRSARRSVGSVAIVLVDSVGAAVRTTSQPALAAAQCHRQDNRMVMVK